MMTLNKGFWTDPVVAGPYNEVHYNPTTWAEWSLSAGVVGDASGVEFTADGSTYPYANRTTNTIKGSTNYGYLFNIVNNNLTSQLYIDDYIVAGFPSLATLGLTGNYKKTITTQASVGTGRVNLTITGDTAGRKIKLKDIRVFELPSGSQIATDFANDTPDQLNTKYPFGA